MREDGTPLSFPRWSLLSPLQSPTAEREKIHDMSADIVRGWEIPWLVALSSARPSSSSIFSFAARGWGEESAAVSHPGGWWLIFAARALSVLRVSWVSAQAFVPGSSAEGGDSLHRGLACGFSSLWVLARSCLFSLFHCFLPCQQLFPPPPSTSAFQCQTTPAYFPHMLTFSSNIPYSSATRRKPTSSHCLYEMLLHPGLNSLCWCALHFAKKYHVLLSA